MTVFEILNRTTHYLKDHQIENPRLNAELLLGCSMNRSREGLYLLFHEEIGKEEEERLERLIQRRVTGEPLQYILGHQEFWSRRFKVDPHVLIPRPETEGLVEEGLLVLSERISKRPPSVLELGTGCGAIAISLAREIKDLFIVATDLSGEALRVARENARNTGVLDKIAFVNGDLFHPFHLLKKPFDLILSNPPYIMDSEIEKLAQEVKDHEPRIALSGGVDGLDFYQRIISQAPLYLNDGGWLLLEVGDGQADKVSEIMESAGQFRRAERVKDLSGMERVIKARKVEKAER